MILGVTLPLSDIGGDRQIARLCRNRRSRSRKHWRRSLVSTSADEASWREEFKFWKSAGVTHVTVNSAFERNHHRRIASRSLQAHLTAFERYRDAVADLL